MNPLIGMITNQLGGQVLEQIGQQIGTDSNTTQSAVNAALPMVLSALGNHANSDEGAAQLQEAADSNNSILEDVMGFVSNSQGGGVGEVLLNQFLGGQSSAIANVVSQHTGLGAGPVSQLLSILTPIIMGVIGKFSQSTGMDAGGVAQLVGEAAGNSGGNDLLGMATKFLDSDGDGNAMEEIGGLIGKFF